jgi:hypothetical protein
MHRYRHVDTIAIPDPASSWPDIEIFALTFNAYERLGSTDQVARIGTRVEEAYRATGTFPGSVDDLRTCLFLFQRRAHWDWDIAGSEEHMALLRALLASLHEKTGGTVPGPGDPWP